MNLKSSLLELRNKLEDRKINVERIQEFIDWINQTPEAREILTSLGLEFTVTKIDPPKFLSNEMHPDGRGGACFTSLIKEQCPDCGYQLGD